MPSANGSRTTGSVAPDETETSMADRDGDALTHGDDELDEQIEAAERRGMGRGTILGLGIAVFIVLVTAVVLIWWNPFANTGPSADNTVPVTTLPQPSHMPTEDLPVATATVVTPAPEPSESVTTSPQESMSLALNRWNWLPEQQAFSVAGFIDGAEDGGTCTLTAASGGLTLVATNPATKNVTTTDCVVNLQSAEVVPGDWQLTMTYEGPSGTATSETVTVTVP